MTEHIFYKITFSMVEWPRTLLKGSFKYFFHINLLIFTHFVYAVTGKSLLSFYLSVFLWYRPGLQTYIFFQNKTCDVQLFNWYIIPASIILICKSQMFLVEFWIPNSHMNNLTFIFFKNLEADLRLSHNWIINHFLYNL